MSGKQESGSLAKKAKKKAAKRPSQSTSERLPWKRRLALASKFGALLAAVALIGLFAWRSYASPQGGGFRTTQVDFVGLQQLERSVLESQVEDLLHDNILRIDLDELRRRIESATWVRSAVVRRRLPGRLRIEVVERQPEALAKVADEMLLVDAEGVVLGPHQPGFPLPDRPLVLGLVADEGPQARRGNAARMALYLRVLGDLAGQDWDHSSKVSEIDVGEAKRVAVVPVEEPVRVVLGDRDFRLRYENFLSQMDVYKEYKRKHGKIESVDASYDKRIIFRTPKSGDGVVARK